MRDDSVVAIQEKPVLERCVNAGVYVISPRVLELVPRKSFLITDLLKNMLDRGEKVGSYEIITDWTDVGQHSELSKARGGV
jgi:NDP-sugar pyrophosphorylase family protein